MPQDPMIETCFTLLDCNIKRNAFRVEEELLHRQSLSKFAPQTVASEQEGAGCELERAGAVKNNVLSVLSGLVKANVTEEISLSNKSLGSGRK